MLDSTSIFDEFDEFEVKTGFLQGDDLFLLLFSIVLEILESSWKNHKEH